MYRRPPDVPMAKGRLIKIEGKRSRHRPRLAQDEIIKKIL